jgi:hypothetical protein
MPVPPRTRRSAACIRREQHPDRAERVAEHLEQIVRSGDWPGAVPIDISWVTDGFALARQGIWTYEHAALNFEALLAKIASLSNQAGSVG